MHQQIAAVDYTVQSFFNSFCCALYVRIYIKQTRVIHKIISSKYQKLNWRLVLNYAPAGLRDVSL
jgi:hypothetical protein